MLPDSYLKAKGLLAYEISNHAFAGEECRHNLMTWQCGDWLAVGAGAHGRLSTRQGRYHTMNFRSPKSWLKSVLDNGHSIDISCYESMAESFDEYWMMGLRLTSGVPIVPPTLFGGYTLPQYWLKPFIDEGWLCKTQGTLFATLEGRLRLDFILGKLLGEKQSLEETSSKALIY